MRFVFHNIQDAFASWGKKKRALPLMADDMKASVMASLTTRESVHVEKPKKQYWRFAFAATAMVAVVLIVHTGSVFVSRNLSSATGSGTVAPLGMALEGSRASTAENFGLMKMQVSQRTASPAALEVSVNDTREYLKVNYGATLYTRHVADVANRAQTIVRGHGGRVDRVSINTKYADIFFVMPKASFDQFARELKTLVPARLVVENVNQNNLLPEKRHIETRTEDANTRLWQIQRDRQTLIDTHAATVRSYESRIAGYDRSIALLERDMATSTITAPEMVRQLSGLQSERRVWVQRLAAEQSTFRNTLSYRDADIASVQNQIVGLQDEDAALIDNVETVEGSVSILWINLFELFLRYAPLSYVAAGFAFLLLVILYRQGRRRTFDDIVFP